MFPPPLNGQSIATQTLADLIDGEVDLTCFDTSYGDLKPTRFGWESVVYHVAFARMMVRNYVQLVRLLRRESFDVLYFVASGTPLGHLKNWVMLKLARPHVPRVVAHVHNGNFGDLFRRSWQRATAREVVRSVDTFVCLSEMLRDQLARFVPESRTFILPNPIDEGVQCLPEEVNRQISTRAAQPASEGLRVLYLSNMVPTKGYQDLTEAVRHLHAEGRRPTVDFIGGWTTKADRRAFTRYLDRHDLHEVVTVHGRVADRHRIRAMLLDADVFALPTYYPNEAQPISIIEALNAGTPIIATRHASIPEYVFDGRNGYLVEKQAPEQIAEALRLLQDRARWATMAREARAVYEARFATDTVRDQMVAALTGQAASA